MEFKNEGLEDFLMDGKAEYIVFRGESIPIISVSAMNTKEALLETEIYRVKFSKGLANVYLKNSNELLDTFSFTKFSNKKEIVDNTLISTFVLKKDFYIKLYIDNNTGNSTVSGTGKKDFYITTGSETVFNTDNVIKVEECGSDTNYVCQESVLTVSKLRNCKFNGIPIGLL